MIIDCQAFTSVSPGSIVCLSDASRESTKCAVPQRTKLPQVSTRKRSVMLCRYVTRVRVSLALLDQADVPSSQSKPLSRALHAAHEHVRLYLDRSIAIALMKRRWEQVCIHWHSVLCPRLCVYLRHSARFQQHRAYDRRAQSRVGHTAPARRPRAASGPHALRHHTSDDSSRHYRTIAV